MDKDLYGVKLRLVLVLAHETDVNMSSRLKQVAIKYDHTTSNIKPFKIEGIDNIDNPTTPGLELSSRKIIMGIK